MDWLRRRGEIGVGVLRRGEIALGNGGPLGEKEFGAQGGPVSFLPFHLQPPLRLESSSKQALSGSVPGSSKLASVVEKMQTSRFEIFLRPRLSVDRETNPNQPG